MICPRCNYQVDLGNLTEKQAAFALMKVRNPELSSSEVARRVGYAQPYNVTGPRANANVGIQRAKEALRRSARDKARGIRDRSLMRAAAKLEHEDDARVLLMAAQVTTDIMVKSGDDHTAEIDPSDYARLAAKTRAAVLFAVRMTLDNPVRATEFFKRHREWYTTIGAQLIADRP